VTVFLGCGFAAKYREGGGNFSVPLQWMLGLRRLKQDAIWLELLPATEDRAADAACIANFQRQLRAHELAGRYCLLYKERPGNEHDLATIRCIGLPKRKLRERLAGPRVQTILARRGRGGIPLHAGCKIIPTERGKRVGLIVGLSGTGKTTTTFTRQNGSLPVQDDFVAWWPDGSISATEAGCFAKTFALNPKDEPTIHGAVTKPGARILDAPLCYSCGAKMQPAGSCYVCTGCGSTSGCS